MTAQQRITVRLALQNARKTLVAMRSLATPSEDGLIPVLVDLDIKTIDEALAIVRVPEPVKASFFCE